LAESANSDLNNSQVITKNQDIGGLDATVTVDHRVFSGDGLQDIANDFEDTIDHAEEIGVSAQQVATLDSVGIEDFAGLVNDKAEIRTGVAQIHDQENKEGDNELRDVINDSEASAEETQDALSALAQALTGDESQQVDLYSEGENGTENLKGFYDDADGQIALNTQQTDMTDVSDKVEVVGHESYHAKLDQEDSGFSEADREALAHDAGERTSEHWNKENSRDGITTSAGSNADWNKNNQNSNTISFGNASVDGKTADEVEPLLPEFVEDARAAVLDHQEESQQASEALKGDGLGTALSIAAAPGDMVIDIADAALTVVDKTTDLIGATGALGEDLQQEAVGNINNDIAALENAYENKEEIANAILEDLKAFPEKLADADPAAIRSLIAVVGEAAIPAGVLANVNKVDMPDAPNVDIADDNQLDTNSDGDFYDNIDLAGSEGSTPIIDYNKLRDQTGIDAGELENVVLAGNGNRPDPSEYLSSEYIEDHLSTFDEGAVRFTSREKVEEYGTAGTDQAFVIPKAEFDKVVKESNGDLRAVESKLGLSNGYLGDSDTMAVLIKKEDMVDLRVASGNETGANQFWIPGGKTSGGVPEAILDLSEAPFEEIEYK